MTAKSKKICPVVPLGLADGIQKARDAGKRFKGDLYSYSMAFEIGAMVLLDIADGEEILLQKKNDIQIQRSLLDSQEKIIDDQLKAIKTEQKAEKEEFLQKQEEIKKLAHMIISNYEKITVFKKTEHIGYIVTAFPGKLTRDKVAALFVEKEKPPLETALKLAKEALYPDLCLDSCPDSEEVKSSE
jgi:hypothetical protein